MTTPTNLHRERAFNAMAIIKVFKTYTFKIHNLSNTKKAKLDKSIKQATMLYYKLIDSVKESSNKIVSDIAELRALEKENIYDSDTDKNNACKAVNAHIKSMKKEFMVEISKKFLEIAKPIPFGMQIKDGVIEDALAQISSFIELHEIGQNASLPQRNDEEIDFHLAMTDLLTSTTVEQENSARDKLAKIKKDKSRPLNFSRYRDNAIYIDDKNRLFALPKLWTKNDKRCKKILIDAVDARTGEIVKGSTTLGMMLPLECSPRQKQALIDGTAKTSKIYKKNDEYFLAVAIEFKVESRETEYVLGIDRGICEVASYAVRHKVTGKVVEQGTFDGIALREHQRLLEMKQKLSQAKGRRIISGWSNYANNLMHNISKEIVHIADKWTAQVVIEDLSAIKNGSHHKRKFGARKGGFRRMLSRQQYGKLESQLTYKLQSIGLPKPLMVRAAGTSCTCPKCGSDNKENRLKDTEELRAIFHCQNCGHKAHSDINAAVNIAGKRIWFDANKAKMKKGCKLPENLTFNNWQSANLSID